MNLLRYKDYLATIELDPDAGLFHGEVINTRAVLTFQGRSIDDLSAAFSETIADYEDWCKERGKEPERPYSGSFTLRMPPDLHRRVAEAAARSGRASTASSKTPWRTPFDARSSLFSFGRKPLRLRRFLSRPAALLR